MHRLLKFIKSLFSGDPGGDSEPGLSSEIEELRLQLEEKTTRLASAREEIERLHSERGRQSDDDSEAALRSESQELRLQLDERSIELASARKEIERLRNECQKAAEEGAESRLAELVESMASPTTQLLLQQHLIEVQGKELAGADVMTLAGCLISSLQEIGVEPEGAPGDETVFDPGLHQAMDATCQITAGERVLIKIPGLKLSGRILRRAFVTQKEG